MQGRLIFLLSLLVSFHATFGLAAVNDSFANRTLLTGTNVTVSGDNSDAGTEPGEDIGAGFVYWYY